MSREIYRISGEGGFSRDFGLRDQIRRASVSILSNIAEGFERGGNPEFIQFLSVAKGSVAEVKTQLYVASDQRYIDQEIFRRLLGLTSEVGRLIGGLMNYLRRSKIRGSKYRRELAASSNSKL